MMRYSINTIICVTSEDINLGWMLSPPNSIVPFQRCDLFLPYDETENELNFEISDDKLKLSG